MIKTNGYDKSQRGFQTLTVSVFKYRTHCSGGCFDVARIDCTGPTWACAKVSNTRARHFTPLGKVKRPVK